MKTFPKLLQTSVRIGIGNGKVINVPMLPVSAIGELKSFTAQLDKCESMAEFAAIRERMAAMAKTVLPADLTPQLERFQIPQLAELLGYLAYGDPEDDDQPVDPAKKN